MHLAAKTVTQIKCRRYPANSHHRDLWKIQDLNLGHSNVAVLLVVVGYNWEYWQEHLVKLVQCCDCIYWCSWYFVELAFI